MPFKGINNLRDHNESVSVEPWQLEELKKCAKEPMYFIMNYVYINTKDHGMQLFKMWDFQKEVLKKYIDFRFNILRFPRQSGKSTTTMAYLLWYSIFNKQKVVVILANKLSLAQEQLQQLRDAYISLPYWIQPGVSTWAKREVRLSHGTRIKCAATSPDTVRGMAINCVTGNGIITVRDKQTGEIKKMSMKELHDDLNEEQNIIDVRLFDLKGE